MKKKQQHDSQAVQCDQGNTILISIQQFDTTEIQDISYIVYRMIYSQTVLAGPIYTIHRNDTCTHEEHTRCIHLISLLLFFLSI